MPLIATLSGRSTFRYTLDGDGGFFIEYAGRPHITSEIIEKVKAAFGGKLIPGGFCRTDPIPHGFGEWIRDNSPFNPQNASHIAAVLKELGVIRRAIGRKPIMLQF